MAEKLCKHWSFGSQVVNLFALRVHCSDCLLRDVCHGDTATEGEGEWMPPLLSPLISCLLVISLSTTQSRGHLSEGALSQRRCGLLLATKKGLQSPFGKTCSSSLTFLCSGPLQPSKINKELLQRVSHFVRADDWFYLQGCGFHFPVTLIKSLWHDLIQSGVCKHWSVDSEKLCDMCTPCHLVHFTAGLRPITIQLSNWRHRESLSVTAALHQYDAQPHNTCLIVFADLAHSPYCM